MDILLARKEITAKAKKVTFEKLLEDLGRVRSVKQAPDGYIYVGIENKGIVKIIQNNNTNKF